MLNLNSDGSAQNSSTAHAPVSLVPLSMVRTGVAVKVKSLKGNPETVRFLANLGFVENTPVSVVSEMGGNVIVQVKDSRIAISRSMANKIITSNS